MTAEGWATLMRNARRHAAIHRARVRVRAYRVSPLITLYSGTSWAYVIECHKDRSCSAPWADR